MINLSIGFGIGSLIYSQNSTTATVLVESNTFDGDGWTPTGVTPSGNTITEDTSTGAHRIQKDMPTITAGQTITLQVDVEKGADRNILLNYGASRLYANFDMTSGTLGATGSNAEFTNVEASISDIGTHWRLSLTGERVSGTINYVRIELNNVTAGSAPNYTGDGSSSATLRDFKLLEI